MPRPEAAVSSAPGVVEVPASSAAPSRMMPTTWRLRQATLSQRRSGGSRRSGFSIGGAGGLAEDMAGRGAQEN